MQYSVTDLLAICSSLCLSQLRDIVGVYKSMNKTQEAKPKQNKPTKLLCITCFWAWYNCSKVMLVIY